MIFPYDAHIETEKYHLHMGKHKVSTNSFYMTFPNEASYRNVFPYDYILYYMTRRSRSIKKASVLSYRTKKFYIDAHMGISRF